MNERMKWAMVLATITVFVMTAAFFPGLVHAGDLDPTKPPGSTMHTLDEIYDKLETIETNGEPCEPCKEAPVGKTGQITSYAAGDDGDLGKGAWSQPRFTDNGDHTVTDNLTGLMWMQEADKFDMRSWSEALSVCAACDEGGYTDWRLPNVKELQSLIDYGQIAPALPGGPFALHWEEPGYWSSTTFPDGSDHAWTVDFDTGRVVFSRKGDGRGVWCVRGGR